MNRRALGLLGARGGFSNSLGLRGRGRGERWLKGKLVKGEGLTIGTVVRRLWMIKALVV